MSTVDQRVRILLVRLLALENRRPVTTEHILHEAAAEGIPAPATHLALDRLVEAGAVMRVPEGWVSCAPRLPLDVTDERAARMRLYGEGSTSTEAHARGPRRS